MITGAVRAARDGAGQRDHPRLQFGLRRSTTTARSLSVYDKVHLVPFGEYLPFQDLLERLGLMQLTKVRGGFIAGDRRRNQHVPGAPNFLPLVCYEIIFPGEAVAARRAAGLAAQPHQ